MTFHCSIITVTRQRQAKPDEPLTGLEIEQSTLAAPYRLMHWSERFYRERTSRSLRLAKAESQQPRHFNKWALQFHLKSARIPGTQDAFKGFLR